MSLLVVVALAGCAGSDPADEELGRLALPVDVEDFVDASCSTSVVIGLSIQIAKEVDCMAPGTLVPFEEGNGISFTGSAVLPYIAPEAKADLLAAVAANGGTLQVNSAYRTVVQQYLLYRWFQQGRCGITAAAEPGSSNHESGRALDVENYSAWIGALGNHGWGHTVPGDPVHFDHLASPDLRGADVLAFQRLWNRNHPGDPVDEDGGYGPATAARLAAAPAGGFAQGGDCTSPPDDGAWNAARDTSDVPAEIVSGERVRVWVELVNTGTTTWTPGGTFLGTTQPRDRASALFDQENWISAARATGVDANTPPGATGRFSFMIHAPDVTTDTMLSESFGLVQEGVTWFGPEDVTIEILVLAAGSGPGGPGGPGPGDDPNEGNGNDGDDGGLAGGCAVSAPGGGGGAATPLVLALLAAAAATRGRRRRREPLRPAR